MYEKSSNLTSIIIAIVAVLLILGGVFLLNQTFNSNRPKTSDIASESSSSSAGGLLLGNVSANNSNSASTSTNNSTNNSANSVGSSTGNSANSSAISSTSSSQSSRSATSSSGASTSSTGNYNLASNEFVAKAITPTAKGSNYEIIECKISSPTYCKAGFKFPYSINGEVGKTYKFSGGSITDGSDGLQVSGVRPAAI